MGSGSSAAIRHGLASSSAEGLREFVLGLPSEEQSKLQEAVEKAQGQSIALGTADLSSFFGKTYVDGGLYDGLSYKEDMIEGSQPTYRYDAPDGPVHVWRHALDLCGSPEEEDVIVLYHYTNLLGFMNVLGFTQSAVDSRAHFGKGLYATQHEPSVWQHRLRILLNNYSNGDPWRVDLEDDECKLRNQEWGDGSALGHRAAFCVPLRVPRELAYNIFQRLTPDMKQRRVQGEDGRERAVKLGEDYKGREVHSSRDVWVVRLMDENGQVKHATAANRGLIDLLTIRLSKLRTTRKLSDTQAFDCAMELGFRLLSRGRFNEAEGLLKDCYNECKKELGDVHPTTVQSVLALAHTCREHGQLLTAEHLLRDSVAAVKSQLSPEEASKSMPALANELVQCFVDLDRFEDAEQFLQDVEPFLSPEYCCQGRAQLKMGRLANSGKPEQLREKYRGELLESRRKLGAMLILRPMLRDQLDSAEQKLGMHPILLETMAIISRLNALQDKGEESIELGKRSYEGSLEMLGASHPQTMDRLRQLAEIFEMVGRTREAEQLYHSYIHLCEEAFGEMHPKSLQTKALLALLLFKHGRQSEEAMKLGLEAVTGSLSASDGCPDRPDEEISEAVDLIDVMAPHLLHQGRFHEALPLLQSSLKTKEAKLGSSHSITEQTRSAFANCLAYLGRWNEVEALCRERLEALQQVSPPNWEKISTMKRGLAGSLLQQLRFAEADQLLQEALETNRRELGNFFILRALLEEVQQAEASAWQDLKEKRQRLGDTLNPELRQSITTLQKLLQCQGRLKEVEALMWELLKTNRADLEKGKHAETRDGLDWLESTLLAILLAEARVSEAEHLLKEDLELKRRTLGNENMSTLNTLGQLASLLEQQGRHAEAEPLLQEAIKGKR
ncbi:Klc, partial [Symbiodinium sp. CCMP2456]